MPHTAQIVLLVLVVVGATGQAANVITAPVPWRGGAADTRGETVDADRLRGHATLVTFSSGRAAIGRCASGRRRAAASAPAPAT